MLRCSSAANLLNLRLCERGLPTSWKVKLAIGKFMKIIVKR